MLKDKIAVVTGGARGIGKGIVKKLADEGLEVVVADIEDEEGIKSVNEINADTSGHVIYRHVDLLEDVFVENFFYSIEEEFGRIDILVCDAGIQIREWATEFPMEQFDRLLGINLRAYYLCSRLAARMMQKQPEGGAIVCISSVNSIQYHSRRSPYNISKAAVNGMVGTLAVEWGRYNIRINAVAPGYVLTDLMKSGIAEGIIDEKNIMSVIPMKRYISIEEVSNAVWFLASDMASGITGQVLCVDGGWSKNALPEEL